MNTEVSFEIAKLLKEKRFDKICKHIYAYGNTTTIDNFARIDNSNDRGYYSAPTIAEVVMWLYEKRGIWVGVRINGLFYTFQFSLHFATSNGSLSNIERGGFASLIEAYTAAIQYVLNNLI